MRAYLTDFALFICFAFVFLMTSALIDSIYEFRSSAVTTTINHFKFPGASHFDSKSDFNQNHGEMFFRLLWI
ncbi:hypothetical protein L596_010707 [Steinernema carpocapsae]|uniref:Uncharacterized protein n=1 Tax=Steinernema carpocapsae TaxID=34508 RepID=A0A4U5PJB9_STECR|nr:hypothetical protein L596_010707 [Steinernema carpocapsae]